MLSGDPLLLLQHIFAATRYEPYREVQREADGEVPSAKMTAGYTQVERRPERLPDRDSEDPDQGRTIPRRQLASAILGKGILFPCDVSRKDWEAPAPDDTDTPQLRHDQNRSPGD